MSDAFRCDSCDELVPGDPAGEYHDIKRDDTGALSYHPRDLCADCSGLVAEAIASDGRALLDDTDAPDSGGDDE